MSLARHSTYNVLGFLLPTLLTIVTVPIYLKLIGIERYGLLALCWTVLSFAGFAGLGIGPSVNRLIASHRSSAPHERAKVFWTGLKASVLVAIGWNKSDQLFGYRGELPLVLSLASFLHVHFR